ACKSLVLSSQTLWSQGLRFLRQRLSSCYANLRISLRKMRKRQRNPGPIARLDGNQVSALRFDQGVEEVFGFCLEQRRKPSPELQWCPKFLRDVRHGPAAFALIQRLL